VTVRYPDGLTGGQIRSARTAGSRTYDALTSSRPYRAAPARDRIEHHVIG
jgi:response regulator RpfG family c-di-GMP phosphodiesterase